MTSDEFNIKEDVDRIVLFHPIKADEDISDAVDGIWNLLQEAHNEFPGRELSLIIDIEGHRNENGGFTDGMYFLQETLCIPIIAAFVDKLTIPLGEYETSDVTIVDALQFDMERVEAEDGEEFKDFEGEDGELDVSPTTEANEIPDDLTAEDLLEHTNLFAQEVPSGEIKWGFNPITP